MLKQIFQNVDTTTQCGVQFPLIHYRLFYDIKNELEKGFTDCRDTEGKRHYRMAGVDIYVEGDAILAFESKDDNEGLLKKVLDFFDLPRDMKSRCIVAFPEDMKRDSVKKCFRNKK